MLKQCYNYIQPLLERTTINMYLLCTQHVITGVISNASTSSYNVLFSSWFEGQIWQRINLKYNDFVSPRSGICHIKFLQFFLTYLRVPFICKMIIKILHENTRFLLNTQKQKETHRTNLPEKPLKTIYQKTLCWSRTKRNMEVVIVEKGLYYVTF